MKVSNEDILEYIWDETLNKIAINSLVKYMGDEVGTYSDNDAAERADNFACLNISSLAAGSGLSYNQFRIRIQRMIVKGDLRKFIRSTSFVINSDLLEEVAIYAAQCWRSIGVPFGMNENRTSCNTLHINALPRSIFELTTNCYLILRTKYPTYHRGYMTK
ncbi:MAG: hypothetical protein SPE06_07595 [[Actinobacillus] rossii]|nr:hypothetical protein [[Actinobacillus] rossii]MDY4506238.1 hypothetical protein [[Actinobacillus] rossii]